MSYSVNCVIQWSEATFCLGHGRLGTELGQRPRHHCASSQGLQTSRLTWPLTHYFPPGQWQSSRSGLPLTVWGGTILHLKGHFCSSYLLPHRTCTWTGNKYLLQLHISQGRKTEGTHCFEFYLFKPRVKPDSGFSFHPTDMPGMHTPG